MRVCVVVNSFVLFYFLQIILLQTATRCDGQGSGRALRRKRYLVFPKGSSVQLTGNWANYYDVNNPAIRIAVLAEFTVGYPLPSSVFEGLYFGPLKKTTHKLLKKVLADKGSGATSFSEYPNEKNGYYTDHKYLIMKNKYPVEATDENSCITKNGFPRDFQIYQYLYDYSKNKRYSDDRKDLQNRIIELLSMHGVDGHACVSRARCEAAQEAPEGADFMRYVMHLLFRDSEAAGRNEEEQSRQCEEAIRICPFSLLDPYLQNVS